MKAQTIVSILAATTLVLAAASAEAQGRNGKGGASAPQRAQVERGQRDFDRDRMRDRGRSNDAAKERKRDQDQDRTHAPTDAGGANEAVYGGELMNAQERKQYREQLRQTESDPEKRAQFMKQHHEKMQERARQSGAKLPDPPNDEDAD